MDDPPLTPNQLRAAFDEMSEEEQTRTGLIIGATSEEVASQCMFCGVKPSGNTWDEDAEDFEEGWWSVQHSRYWIEGRDFTEDSEDVECCPNCSARLGSEYEWSIDYMEERYSTVTAHGSVSSCMTHPQGDTWKIVDSFQIGLEPSDVDAGELMTHIMCVPENTDWKNDMHTCGFGLGRGAKCYSQTFGNLGSYYGRDWREHVWPIEVTFCTCFDGSEPNQPPPQPLADKFSDHYWQTWETEFNQALESSTKEDLENMIECCKEIMVERENRSRMGLLSGGENMNVGVVFHELGNESKSNLRLLIHKIETLISAKKVEGWGVVTEDSLETRLNTYFDQWTLPVILWYCPKCETQSGRWNVCKTPKGKPRIPHKARKKPARGDDEFGGLGSLFG